MRAKRSARERILDAAEEVVLARGASHMTLDAVAAHAGVSKGGLIYHFASLQELLQGMLARFMARAETHRRRVFERLPAQPGRAFKAHLQAWLTLGEAERRSAAALLASCTRDPELIEKVRRRRREVWAEILADWTAPERAVLLALVVEGMWLSELLGVSVLAPSLRRRLRAELLRLTDEWCAAHTAPCTGGGRRCGGRAPVRRR